MDLQLAGKTVLVTGSSSGIGKAIAAKFAEEGSRVFICARRPDALADAARQIAKETGGSVEHFPADVTDPESIAQLSEEVKRRFGGLDILINNAGTGIYKPFLDVTDEDLETGMALNFFSQFRVTRKFVPGMIERGSGSIVNITGTSGMMVLEPPFFATCTGPAKAAEIRFTKMLAAELGPKNIRVNCIAPGLVLAPDRFERWQKQMGKDEDVQTPEDLQRKWGGRVQLPGKRWATLKEVAEATVFTASPASSYTTGTVMVIDGGSDRS